MIPKIILEILSCAATIALAICWYKLRKRIDEFELDMVSFIAYCDKLRDRAAALEKQIQSLDTRCAAEFERFEAEYRENIEASKEYWNEKANSEKKLQEGIDNILNYDYRNYMGGDAK